MPSPLTSDCKFAVRIKLSPVHIWDAVFMDYEINDSLNLKGSQFPQQQDNANGTSHLPGYQETWLQCLQITKKTYAINNKAY